MKAVFISREVRVNGPIQSFCLDQGIQLISQSLLSFKSVHQEKSPTKTDVIFFTSPRSVRFYLDRFTPRNQLLATIGAATADSLIHHNYAVDFVGKTASDPKQVAKDFKAWLGNKSVLFPQSQRSNRTMQRELNPEQYVDCVMYETQLLKRVFQDLPQHLVFTSPSNVEAYLLSNEIVEDQKVISYGTTTSEYLTERGIDSFCLNEPTETAVVEQLKKR